MIVFANRADGAVGDRGLTDATGQVALEVEVGGAVTAQVTTSGNFHMLSSILGVEPGNILTIDPERDRFGSTGPAPSPTAGRRRPTTITTSPSTP